MTGDHPGRRPAGASGTHAEGWWHRRAAGLDRCRVRRASAALVRRRPRALALGLVIVLAAGGAVTATDAIASPLADAQSRAATLSAQVHRLQDHSEAAAERYAAANAELASAVTRYQQGARGLDSARADLARQQTRTRSRVRALWEGGGTLGMVSSALQTDDLGSLSSRLAAVQHVAQDDRDRLAAAGRAATTTRGLAASLERLALHQTALRGQAHDALLTAQSDVTAEQTLLQRAGADVAHLAEQQREDEARRSAAAFRARLLAAAEAAKVAQAARVARAAGVAQAAKAARAAAAAAGQPADNTGSDPTVTPQTVTTDDLPAASVAAAVLASARTLLGLPYVWGGSGPDGFDCSGLTGWAYAAAGISLPRTAAQQWLSGPHPSIHQMQPGDLLFWASDPSDMSSIHHVALNLGGGMMISTDHPGDLARVQPIWDDEFVGATRPQAAMALAVAGARWAPGS